MSKIKVGATALGGSLAFPTVPTGGKWRIKEAIAVIVTAAAAGNRAFRIKTVTSGGADAVLYDTDVNVAASKTVELRFLQGSIEVYDGTTLTRVAIGNIDLETGYTLQIVDENSISGSDAITWAEIEFEAYFPPATDSTVISNGAITLTGALTAGTVNWAKGTTIASAATVNLATATGNVVDVSGATGPITAFGTAAAGVTRFVRFTGAPTITHNGTSLILPGSRSIDVEAGDRAIFVSLGSGNWYCHAYMKANGEVLGDIPIVTHGASEAATAVTMHKHWHNVTGAYTVTLPAAVIGMSAAFNATTAAVFSLDCQAADHFVLGGTSLTAGNKITSDGYAGSQVEVVCTAANTWTIKHSVGLFVDGGA